MSEDIVFDCLHAEIVNYCLEDKVKNYCTRTIGHLIQYTASFLFCLIVGKRFFYFGIYRIYYWFPFNRTFNS